MMKNFLLVSVFFLLFAACASEKNSSLPVSGIVEGFYGTPWSPEERGDMIAFMGEFGLQHYIYAPKNDPFHRSRWHEPYPDSSIANFRTLLDLGRQHDVTIWFAISPGLSIRYASDEDQQKLEEKILQILDAGFAHVALFLDDVPETLRHPEDIAAYPGIAHAHASLANRLYDFLDARGAHLWICPTVYTNSFGEPAYLDTLGKHLTAEIPLFWTGPDVVSPDILPHEVLEWKQRTGTPALIWDNYPVNDYEVWRPFLGAYPPRNAEGIAHTMGFIANPGPDAYSSMMALAGLPALLADPGNYDAEKIHQNNLKQLFGDDAYEDVAELVTLFAGYGWEDHPFGTMYTPGKDIPYRAIEESLLRGKENLQKLSEITPSNRRLIGFVNEISVYMERLSAMLQQLLSDSRYELSSDYLMYKAELDRYDAVDSTEIPFIHSSFWNDISFHPLFDNNVPVHGVSMQFLAHQDTLYTRLLIDKKRIHSEIDHPDIFSPQVITLAVASDAARTETHVAANDPFLVFDIPKVQTDHSELGRFVLLLDGFSARGIADITMRHVSTFFHQFSAPVPYGDVSYPHVRTETLRSDDHAIVMAAIPIRQNSVRLNWSVSLYEYDENGRRIVRNAIAGRRPSIGNPQAWISIGI